MKRYGVWEGLLFSEVEEGERRWTTMMGVDMEVYKNGNYPLQWSEHIVDYDCGLEP